MGVCERSARADITWIRQRFSKEVLAEIGEEPTNTHQETVSIWMPSQESAFNSQERTTHSTSKLDVLPLTCSFYSFLESTQLSWAPKSLLVKTGAIGLPCAEAVRSRTDEWRALGVPPDTWISLMIANAIEPRWPASHVHLKAFQKAALYFFLEDTAS